MQCAAPSDFLFRPEHTRLAVTFGLTVEPIIRADYLRHVGRQNFFPLQEKDFSDFSSGFSNTTMYISFIKRHNPQLSVSQLLSLSAASLFKIPDLCTHDDPRRLEFYEIKPNSTSGRSAGVTKISEIGALNDSFSLPYKAGRIYAPDVHVTIWEGDLSVGHVVSTLHFKRTQLGLIVYELCQNSPPSVAPLGEVMFEDFMLSVILVWMGIKKTIDVEAMLNPDQGASTGTGLMAINGSVGRNGVNRPRDTMAVQFLVNELLRLNGGGPLLKIDGIAGPKTVGAIEHVQRRHGIFTDGRVDPNGHTLAQLNQTLFKTIAAGIKAVPTAGPVLA